MPATAPQISDGLEAWLRVQQVALAFTTYRANRLLLLGCGEAGGIKVHERLFDRPMGLFAEGDSLWMATRSQIWRLDNHLAPGLRHEGGDRLYVPASCTVTGDVNAHELVVPTAGAWAGQTLFVNTAFSCLAALERGSSFAPRWRPPFVQRLAAEDACHLNGGVALQHGEPLWASACGHQGGASSWRNDRRTGGVLLHLPSNSVAASGLSMPHSPRWYQERLWLLHSGSGELGWIDQERFQPLCALPGFTRGLAFVGSYAVVGLSKVRSPQFTGLALDERLPAEGDPAGCCGLRVIDLRTGAILHSLDLPEPIDELFDVVALPGVRQPRALGLQGEEIECLVRLPEQAEQLQVRPLAPSGSPHQGPLVPTFGLPEPSSAMEPPGTPGLDLTAGPPGGGTAALPDPATLSQPIGYRRVFHLTAANLAPYAALTFPPLTAGSPALQRIQGELLGVSAMVAGAMVAFVIAERRPQGEALLLSLMVAPAWRRRGIGTGLLARLMAFLAAEGLGPLLVRYRVTTLTTAAFEPILARLGWSAPHTDFVLLEGRSPRLAAVGWADRHPISAPYTLLPWGQLSEAQRQSAAQLAAPAELLPPGAEAAQPDPQLSLALLHQNQPVGWLLLHRTGADAVRYSSLYVEPPHRGRARALALLHEGFRRQHAAAIPIARAAIDSRNTAMLRVLQRHLGAHLQAIGQSRSSLSPQG
ncbi:MAG: TIGR03032 family protein [Cyanobium sp.]